MYFPGSWSSKGPLLSRSDNSSFDEGNHSYSSHEHLNEYHTHIDTPPAHTQNELIAAFGDLNAGSATELPPYSQASQAGESSTSHAVQSLPIPSSAGTSSDFNPSRAHTTDTQLCAHGSFSSGTNHAQGLFQGWPQSDWPETLWTGQASNFGRGSLAPNTVGGWGQNDDPVSSWSPLSATSAPLSWSQDGDVTSSTQSPLTTVSLDLSSFSPPPPCTPRPAAAARSASSNSSRPHKCNRCTKLFVKRNDLTRHQRSVHRGQNEPVFRCKCDYSSTRKDNYLRHMRPCQQETPRFVYSCKCGIFSEQKDEHDQHVSDCMFMFGVVGRPRES